MIAIGSDHGGFALKEQLITHLSEKGIDYQDFGCFSPDSVDYPDIASAVAESIAQGHQARGILICGTGIGMSIAANKVKGIRAALCENSFSARMAREHNDAHILCLGGRVSGAAVALEMVDVFLQGTFEGGRHQGRLDKVTQIEDR